MALYIVKIENTGRQIRVTIPKALASQAGLYDKFYCEMTLTDEKNIEVKKLELEKRKQDRLQESSGSADRSAETS